MAARRTSAWSFSATPCWAPLLRIGYSQHFPDEPEGRLTVRKAAIVNDAQLARSARRLGFSELVKLGAGMRNAGGADNTSILADAFEAFVAALFLRYGMEKARTFVVTQHIERLDHAPDALLDAKTRLQHYTQEHLFATPTYTDRNEGTPQTPRFRSTVLVNEKTLGTGTGFLEEGSTAGRRRGGFSIARRRAQRRRPRET